MHANSCERAGFVREWSRKIVALDRRLGRAGAELSIGALQVATKSLPDSPVREFFSSLEWESIMFEAGEMGIVGSTWALLTMSPTARKILRQAWRVGRGERYYISPVAG